MNPIPANYDDQPDPEHAVAPENPAHTAYLESDGLTFRDQPLQPFSARRYAAVQSIGLRLWKLSEEERQAAVTKDDAGNVVSFTYPGMFADAVLVLYVCQCPKSDVLRAVRQPAAIQEKSLDWADEIGIKQDDPELIAPLLTHIFGLSASAAEVVPSKEQKAAAGNG